VPTLLKGVAQIVDGRILQPGARLLGDIDLLVTVKQAKESACALGDIGFSAETPIAFDGILSHQLPKLCHRDTGTGIDVHLCAVTLQHEVVVPTDWIGSGCRIINFRGFDAMLPEVSQRVAHVVVHDQLSHNGYRSKRVELRQLLDVALLRAKHEGRIDWDQIDFRFASAGYGHVLATYLHYAEMLFGQKMPKLRVAPRKNALKHLQDTIDRPGRRSLANLADIAEAVTERIRRRPSWAIGILDPAKMPSRIRVVLSAFRSRKW
jgi:hypothetical protein